MAENENKNDLTIQEFFESLTKNYMRGHEEVLKQSKNFIWQGFDENTEKEGNGEDVDVSEEETEEFDSRKAAIRLLESAEEFALAQQDGHLLLELVKLYNYLD